MDYVVKSRLKFNGERFGPGDVVSGIPKAEVKRLVALGVIEGASDVVESAPEEPERKSELDAAVDARAARRARDKATRERKKADAGGEKLPPGIDPNLTGGGGE
ncbi:MAG: hypothetical protein M1133_16405 [Armatimonadetes bacterium]|nr:hypothetical protein [Armatimonadota bacterium]